MRARVVSLAIKRLESDEQLRRAPTYALLQAELSQLDLLKKRLRSLSEQFDQVLVLLPERTATMSSHQNVQFFEKNHSLQSRWQLLDHCSDGFVFPVSLAKQITADHVKHLKSHLFAVGGANAIGLHNFGAGNRNIFDHKDALSGLVPMPIIDLDYAIFDQRFWGLSGLSLEDQLESVAFAEASKARGFGLFSCPDASCSSIIPKKYSSPYSRLDLAETLVRNPALLKKAGMETIDFWVDTWDYLGLKSGPEGSIELETTLTTYLGKNPGVTMDANLVVSRIVGKTHKRRKVRA